jgi:hypothetical protein
MLGPISFPVAGAEASRKVLEPALPSNELMRRAVNDPAL